MSKHPMVRLAGALLLVVSIANPAGAQFGALKKLKNKVSPDSATKAAQAAQGADTTQRSALSRAVSTAASASQKFEAVTGVSAKDAALAATGVGAGGLVAKKLGLDPASMVRASTASRGGGVTSILQGAGMPGGGIARGAISGLMKRGGSKGAPNAAVAGPSEADQKLVESYMQEMMRLSSAASAGDATAQARLEQLSVIAAKYEGDVEKATMAASGGDMAAMQRMQKIQFDIIREWMAKK